MLHGFPAHDIESQARKNNVHIEYLPERRFFKLEKRNQAQGIIAAVDEFRYLDFEDLINQEIQPKLVCLDRITDPQNLGAIMRTCACLGGFGVVLPKHESAEVNETVLKVACGAENHVPVCRVKNLSTAIEKAKEKGYWIGAAVVEGGQDPRQIKFNLPLGLLFGSEGQGVRPGLLEQADYKITLKMKGARLSLNVALAAGIICYEVCNQR